MGQRAQQNKIYTKLIICMLTFFQSSIVRMGNQSSKFESTLITHEYQTIHHTLSTEINFRINLICQH